MVKYFKKEKFITDYERQYYNLLKELKNKYDIKIVPQ